MKKSPLPPYHQPVPVWEIRAVVLPHYIREARECVREAIQARRWPEAAATAPEWLRLAREAGQRIRHYRAAAQNHPRF